MERNYKEIYKSLRLDGFFSEYLPPCFKLDEQMFKNPAPYDCDLIEPFSFTMSRFNSNDSRRTIFIPEIGAYSALNEFLKNNKIIEELTDFIDNNSLSFSKVIMEDGSIVKHEQVYSNVAEGTESSVSTYIDNIVEKIIKSAGAKNVLKLDIANCFSSIYTHYIPAILMGYDAANENYNLSKNNEDADTLYLRYSKLDDLIRKLNSNQTNGLLVGPIFSTIIVEGLLTRIDIELKENNILFSRYMDDYEVYLFEQNQDEVISLFISILKKYGLSLNFEKQEIVDFPYYIVENFDRIIDFYRENNNEDYDLIKLFNDFFKMEQSGTKGAIRYLLKSIEKDPIKPDNQELFNSYILTIMANDSRSLTKACSLMISANANTKLIKEYVYLITKMLCANLKKKYDLESIWLLYVLIETNNIAKDDEVVQEVLTSDNELAKIMLLRKNLTDDIEKLKDSTISWILNYELYAAEYITEGEFIERLFLDKNLPMYKKLKEDDLHFCY